MSKISSVSSISTVQVQLKSHNSVNHWPHYEVHAVPLAALAPIHCADHDKTEAEYDADVSSASAAEETAIAVALDHFGFFFAHLWRSFDAGDEETENWLAERMDHRPVNVVNKAGLGKKLLKYTSLLPSAGREGIDKRYCSSIFSPTMQQGFSSAPSSALVHSGKKQSEQHDLLRSKHKLAKKIVLN